MLTKPNTEATIKHLKRTMVGYDGNYAALTYYYSSPYRRIVCRVGFPVFLFFALLVVFLIWPSDPKLELSQVHLKRIHVHTGPVNNVDISLEVTVEIHNPNAFSMNYKGLDVAIGYRGKRLGSGHVEAGLRRLKSMDSSYLETELDFDGVEMPYDVEFLLEDLATGTIPFDTVAELSGRLQLIGFDSPLKAMVSCQILVNTNNQTFVRQNCYAS